MVNSKPKIEVAMMHASICAYALPGDVKIERCVQSDGSHKWAVRRGGSCLSHEGHYEWEPLPSSRDDEFLARCRFDSAESAYSAWACNQQNPMT